MPGQAEGLGPIQACARSLQGARDMAAYASQWTSGGGVPTGVLSTEQPITAAQAKEAKRAWNESNSHDGGVAVIGAGLKYSPFTSRRAKCNSSNPARSTFSASGECSAYQLTCS